MRYHLLIITFIISNCAFSQVHTIYGSIINKDTKKGIPFCVVQAKDKNVGAYSDDNGIFTLTINADSVNILVFQCLGYEKKELVIDPHTSDSVIIELQQQSATLNEVSITPLSKKKRKTHILGKKNLQPYGFYAGAYGQEDAILLKANASSNNFLKEVFIYITDDGIPDTKFRVHVYSIDTNTGYPGMELTDSNVILNADKGNEWISVDLGSKRIPLNNGFFISVEWIERHGNIDQSTNLYISNGRMGSEEIACQALGATDGYNKEGALFYSRQPFKKDWFKAMSLLNPMIYCTYNHIK